MLNGALGTAIKCYKIEILYKQCLLIVADCYTVIPLRGSSGTLITRKVAPK